MTHPKPIYKGHRLPGFAIEYRATFLSPCTGGVLGIRHFIGICIMYRYRFYNFRIDDIMLSTYTAVHLIVTFIKLF